MAIEPFKSFQEFIVGPLEKQMVKLDFQITLSFLPLTLLY